MMFKNGDTTLAQYSQTFTADSGTITTELIVNDMSIRHISGDIYFIG
jgi:hypothetical protein